MSQQIPPNRVRVTTSTGTVHGTVVEIYGGGHVHSGPSGAVKVRAIDSPEVLGIFCTWCRTRVDDGPPATLIPDTIAVIEHHLATYSVPA